MNALVLTKDKELAYQRVDDPARPGPDWVRIKVAFAGICNSDLHRGFGGGAYHYPLIMGHEFAGTVLESFPGSRFVPGEGVTVFPLIPCRTCEPCRAGEFAQCVRYDYIGSRRDGAFADEAWAPESCLFRVPAGTSLQEAALTEPCAVALHGVRRMTLRGGETAAVIGAGPIGLMAAQWLRHKGCARVLVADVDPAKLALAASLGFDPVDAARGDPVAGILALTGGRGADRVMEAVGLPLTFLQATQAVARAGEVVFLGNIRGELRIPEADVSSLLRREITIRGTWNSKIMPEDANEWTEVLAEMGRAVRVSPLVSHVLPLSQGAEAFRRILSRGESFGRVLLVP